MRERFPFTLAAIVLVWMILGVACEDRKVRSVKEGAETLEENVEHSTHLAKETYQADRAEGEGRVEAAGDAYEAVREVPMQQAGAEEEEEKEDSEKKGSESQVAE